MTAADVQDRDGGVLLLSTLFGQFPFLCKLFADSAYAGPVFANGIAPVMPNLVTEIVREWVGLPSPVVGRVGAGGHPCQGIYHRPAAARPKTAFARRRAP